MNQAFFFFSVFSLMCMLAAFHIQISGFAHGGVLQALSIALPKVEPMAYFRRIEHRIPLVDASRDSNDRLWS